MLQSQQPRGVATCSFPLQLRAVGEEWVALRRCNVAAWWFTGALCDVASLDNCAACGCLNNAAALQRGRLPPIFFKIKLEIEPL